MVLTTWLRRLGVHLALLAAVLAVVAGIPALAGAAADDRNEAILYFFWGDGCPHCAEAEPVLEQWLEAYPGLEVRAREVWYDAEGQVEFAELAERHGIVPRYVPTFFLGGQNWSGWSEQIEAQLSAAVEACLATGCPDAGTWQVGDPTPTATPEDSEPSDDTIDVPIFGTVDLGGMSLPLITALIAAVDGFNPCSLWVLGVLLALTLRSGSRRVTMIVGLTFIVVTGFVYALFIAGMFTIISIASMAPWLRVVVALIAVAFALINLKDYFWFKKGVSLSIPESAKPGIYQRIRKVLANTDNLPMLVLSTVVLAAGVSIVELACTAGFPIVWTNILAERGVETAGFVMLLLIYMVIYQVDELLIFGAAVVTLRASKLQEKQGRILKLVGGMLMLTLAIVMIVDPSLMSSVGSTLAVFGAAVFATLAVLLVHRVLLPRLGVQMGDHEPATRRRR